MDIGAVQVALGHLRKDVRKQIDMIEACKALETASQILAAMEDTESKLRKVKDEVWQLEKERGYIEEQYQIDLAEFDSQLETHKATETARIADELKVVQDELVDRAERLRLQDAEHKERTNTMLKEIARLDETRVEKSIALQKVQAQINTLRG